MSAKTKNCTFCHRKFRESPLSTPHFLVCARWHEAMVREALWDMVQLAKGEVGNQERTLRHAQAVLGVDGVECECLVCRGAAEPANVLPFEVQ